MGYLRRCAAVALATLAVGILGSATVLGAAAWILTISPTSTTVGASTPFVLTATNVDQGQRIGCIVVDVPGAFQIGATAIVWASGGGEWTIARSGNRVTATAVASARLDVNEQLQFRVTATAQQSGTFGWASAAYAALACNGTALPGDAPVVTVSGPALPPAPTPSPTPTPTPTSPPAPVQPPSSAPPAPGDPGTGPPPPSQEPTMETPRPTGIAGSPGETPGPPRPGAPSGTENEHTIRTGEPAVPAASSDLLPVLIQVGAAQFRVGEAGGETQVATLAIALRGGALAVPAAMLAGPGVILLLWIALQALGVSTWLPAVTRLRGDDRRRARRPPG